MAERMITLSQAAEILGMNKEGLRRMIQTGRLTGHVVGEYLRCLESDIVALAAEGDKREDIDAMAEPVSTGHDEDARNE